MRLAYWIAESNCLQSLTALWQALGWTLLALEQEGICPGGTLGASAQHRSGSLGLLRAWPWAQDAPGLAVLGPFMEQ